MGCRNGVETVKGIVDGSYSSPPVFIIDTSRSQNPLDTSLGHSCLYDRISDAVLGQAVDESVPSFETDLRRCFNCGSPDHSVASCPDPVDRQLVALSRQLFNFLHPDAGQRTSRFYIAEGWKQQRLEWLESYEPGVIHGPLLRNALGLQQGDPGNCVEWLRNMTYWGYPPGWVGQQDPRDLVRSRILADVEDEDDIDEEENVFSIFRDLHDDERVDLKPRSSLETELRPTDHSISIPTSCVSAERKRWAVYPNSAFSSAALSIYSGTPLDKLDSSYDRVSATFTADRRTLWQRIIAEGVGHRDNASVPPWRLPGAFSGSNNLDGKPNFREFAPPPPSITPPPLPPTSTPPLSPSLARTSHNLPGPITKRPALFEACGPDNIGDVQPTDDEGSVKDMDVSDDSE
jgi:zinc finger CCHC domain-containing protein 8